MILVNFWAYLFNICPNKVKLSKTFEIGKSFQCFSESSFAIISHDISFAKSTKLIESEFANKPKDYKNWNIFFPFSVYFEPMQLFLLYHVIWGNCAFHPEVSRKNPMLYNRVPKSASIKNDCLFITINVDLSKNRYIHKRAEKEIKIESLVRLYEPISV